MAQCAANPEITRLAFVASEDGAFFEHKGLDYMSILRAAIAVAKAGGERVQGASTITQQMVKTCCSLRRRPIRARSARPCWRCASNAT